MLVVLLHEIGHGLAAVLTGGSIERIELTPDLGGLCVTRGGWQIVVLSSGYLGSMAFGGLIFLTAFRTRFDRQAAVLLGGALALVTLLYVRTLFGFASGLAFAGLLIGAGLKLSEKVNDTLLSFLGLTSMLYAIIDIKEDLLVRTVPQSDAYALSRILPLPSVVWGAIWAALAVAMLAAVCFQALKQPND